VQWIRPRFIRKQWEKITTKANKLMKLGIPKFKAWELKNIGKAIGEI